MKSGKTFKLNSSIQRNVKVENISTSQLLKETLLRNGSKQEEYVITIFSEAFYTKTNEKAKEGCKLVTRIYVTYDCIEGGKDALKL